MDSYVLAIGTKKSLQKMQKEYEDLVSKVFNYSTIGIHGGFTKLLFFFV